MDMYQLQQFPQPMTKMDTMMRKREGSKGTEKARLQVLDLSCLSLDSLPKPSFDLATICMLNLSNNNLQEIPESLTARLLNLEVLDVCSNQLRSLPNSIGCLSKLKVLNVSGNFIEFLPKTIENCRALEELNANFNKLSKLPDTIGFELINLKKLAVNSNKLVFLPSSTSHLTALKVLDARLNCLRALPEDLENLINLETLNVSQNFQYLESLPYSIGLLLSLVELDVSYNKIKTLPESIGCLKKLQKLSVEGNPLSCPPVDVVEHGLHAVMEYMCQKINSNHQSPTKKRWWVGKLVKCGTFDRPMKSGKREHAGYKMLQFQSINGLASPGFMGKLSPLRLFSPRRSFS
ncbi:plant intracellular Ras-group-related LRR protein 6-like [Abrus precatorius]|uniref:Plant intracellular Ras-group-related LRR protein 6-like n=1 Tax=Abrus precatorius TaxID=3816 RepID=A0A8B8K561_ABRPR|nr:plant intracellular Ras-group-related LRR protein 6-like [Abrus precatorius]